MGNNKDTLKGLTAELFEYHSEKYKEPTLGYDRIGRSSMVDRNMERQLCEENIEIAKQIITMLPNLTFQELKDLFVYRIDHERSISESINNATQELFIAVLSELSNRRDDNVLEIYLLAMQIYYFKDKERSLVSGYSGPRYLDHVIYSKAIKALEKDGRKAAVNVIMDEMSLISKYRYRYGLDNDLLETYRDNMSNRATYCIDSLTNLKNKRAAKYFLKLANRKNEHYVHEKAKKALKSLDLSIIEKIILKIYLNLPLIIILVLTFIILYIIFN